MTDEIKPCPFCGDNNVKPHLAEGYGWELFCHHCDNVSVAFFHSEKQAVDFWNNRPIEAALEKRVGQLEREVLTAKMQLAMEIGVTV